MYKILTNMLYCIHQTVVFEQIYTELHQAYSLHSYILLSINHTTTHHTRRHAPNRSCTAMHCIVNAVQAALSKSQMTQRIVAERDVELTQHRKTWCQFESFLQIDSWHRQLTFPGLTFNNCP